MRKCAKVLMKIWRNLEESFKKLWRKFEEIFLKIFVVEKIWRNFNVNTFLKSVSTLKIRVTYDLNTDTDTTTHKIIEVVGSPLYLPSPVSTALLKSHLSL